MSAEKPEKVYPLSYVIWHMQAGLGPVAPGKVIAVDDKR